MIYVHITNILRLPAQIDCHSLSLTLMARTINGHFDSIAWLEQNLSEKNSPPKLTAMIN